MQYKNLKILDHPLIQQKLYYIRSKYSNNLSFRNMLDEVAALMVYEVTRDLPVIEREVETPLETTKAYVLAKKVTLVPILRAGMAMCDGILKIIPQSFPEKLMKSNLSAKDQFNILLLSDRITYTPSYFFNKEALEKVGNYDESNRLVEDYPMWLKLTQSGERLYYFHKTTVGYWIHSAALNNVGHDVLFKPSEINGFLVRKKYVH